MAIHTSLRQPLERTSSIAGARLMIKQKVRLKELLVISTLNKLIIRER